MLSAQLGDDCVYARCAIIFALAFALVAQLDRASDFESEGREFESLRARQQFSNASMDFKNCVPCRRAVLPDSANHEMKWKRNKLEMGEKPAMEMSEAISARVIAQWENWKTQDAGNNAFIAEEYVSCWPDGSCHVGRPTAEQMRAQPITGYTLSQFRALPIGADAALVTYLADVTVPSGGTEHQLAVGEFWVKRGGEWLIRAYSGTLIR
jgi:hypothetical protein